VWAGRGGIGSVHLLLWGVMAAWGLNIPAVKVLTGALDVVWVAVLRMVLAAATLSVVVLLHHGGWPRLGIRHWRWIVPAGALCVYANQMLFAWGLGRTSSTNVSLAMALTPSMALVAGALAFREPVRRVVLAGIAAGFAGVALVTLQAPGAELSTPGLGELLVLLGLVVFVIGGLFVQKLAGQLDTLAVAWGVQVAGASMLCLHAAADGGVGEALQALGDPRVATCLIYSGVVGTAFSAVAWYHGVSRIGIGAAGAYFYVLPVFGVVFSALLLGEQLTAWHAIGLVLVVLGTRLGRGAARATPARGR
jgi:drug/metabolite transporter (DMT)-like permease